MNKGLFAVAALQAVKTAQILRHNRCTNLLGGRITT
jgi:hypothetical protein